MRLNEQLYEVLNYNFGCYDIKQQYVDELLKKWKENKQNIKDKFFHGNLILTYDLEKIDIDLESEFTYSNYRYFIGWQTINILKKYYNDNEVEAITDIIKLISVEEYSYNKLEKNYGEYGKKGARFTKFLKNVVKNKDAAEELINKYSMNIQNLKLSGQLCISIHPLDYITVSENNNNWHSCHSINGSYFAGNLSYIADASTVVIYIKSKEDTQLENFPHGLLWNNKKWRVLAHFDENYNTIIFNRQYPYLNNNIINVIKDTFLKEWNFNIELTNDKNFKVNIHNYSPNEPTNNGKNAPLFYSDLLLARYNKNNKRYIFCNEKQNDYADFYIGEYVPCLSCGYELNLSEGVVCSSCNDNYDICEICGCPIHNEDTYLIKNYLICSDCHDNYVVYCERCDQAILTTAMDYISNDYGIFCEYCWKEKRIELEEEE